MSADLKPDASPLSPPKSEGNCDWAWTRLFGAAKSLAIAEAVKRHSGLVVAVVGETNTALRFADEVPFFGPDIAHYHLPDWEILPYDQFSPYQDIISERISTLSALPHLQQGLLIVSIATLMHRIIPRAWLAGQTFDLKLGDTLDRVALQTRLVEAGYRNVSQVMDHGDFAIRGSIVDIFAMGAPNPFRIDLFDDEIETLRVFDAESQRSIENVDSLQLMPARETPLTSDAIAIFKRCWRLAFDGLPTSSPVYSDVSEGLAPAGIEYYLPLFFEQLDTLFDYLPANALFILDEGVEAGAEAFRHSVDERFEQLRYDVERPILPAEAKCVNREFVRDGTLLAAAEMLRGGTTCFHDMYFFPDEAAGAAIEAGIRAVVGMIVIDLPSAWASNVDEYLHNGQMVHDRYRSHPLIETTFAPHAPYTVDDTSLRRVATLAEELDVPIQMHIHETTAEIARSVAETGKRPLARLVELGMLSHRLMAVHMTELIEEEIELIARAGVSIVHCPESNLKLASGFCPVEKLAAAGVNIAIGTDGAASNNDLDMLSEMRTAALLAKGVSSNASALPAAEALRMATFGGAQALGLEAELGGLGDGKMADLVAFDLGDFRAAPVYDPISQIVYAGHRDQVTNVWVGGRRVVNDRQLASIDAVALKRTAASWHQQIERS